MTRLETERIKGHTEAMEWCMELAKRWREQSEKLTDEEQLHAGFPDQFADELEEHIDQYANT